MDEEDEGSKFCEEDIDQILQRRTKTITIESEGRGSTFAKVQKQQVFLWQHRPVNLIECYKNLYLHKSRWLLYVHLYVRYVFWDLIYIIIMCM